MRFACVELTKFDYAQYVAACKSLSVSFYLMSMEGQECRIFRRVPLSQSKEDQQELSAISAWAERTDPHSEIRRSSIKAQLQQPKMTVMQNSARYFISCAAAILVWEFCVEPVYASMPTLAALEMFIQTP